MYGMLLKLASWVLQKLLAAALIVGLALAVYAGWLYLQDERVLEAERVDRLQKAITTRDEVVAAQAALTQQITNLRTELKAQQDRAKRAAEIVAALRQLESWWDRWFGNPAQQSANVEQMQRMEALKSSATANVAALKDLVGRSVRENETLLISVHQASAEVTRLEASQSKPRQYVIAAWEKTKWWVALALATYFFGPTLWLVTMYYVVGGILVRGRAIRLGGEPETLPAVTASHVSLDAKLAPGELLRVKEKFLQSSDEGIKRATRFVLDWRIPFTSVACGLVELVELRNAEAGPGAFQVTLSNSDDPHLELAAVDIPAGASLVLRPSFLVGVVQRETKACAFAATGESFTCRRGLAVSFVFSSFSARAG